MAIKTILVCLSAETDADAVMNAAGTLARRHDAHVIGLHVLEALRIYPGIGMHITDTVYTTYMQAQTKQADALKAVFDRHTHAEDYVSEWRVVESQADLSAERIVESGRCADVVLLAAAAADTSGSHIRMTEAVIRDVGRPVLVVPAGFDADKLGHSVLIGWNGTREAARAAYDALTLLQDGDSAHILRVNDKSAATDEDAISNDLAAAFARHGITTTLVTRTWERPGIAAALNKEAFEKGADMIAVGAFGHSRAYDLMIGAATRELLRQADFPILFSR